MNEVLGVDIYRGGGQANLLCVWGDAVFNFYVKGETFFSCAKAGTNIFCNMFS